MYLHDFKIIEEAWNKINADNFENQSNKAESEIFHNETYDDNQEEDYMPNMQNDKMEHRLIQSTKKDNKHIAHQFKIISQDVHRIKNSTKLEHIIDQMIKYKIGATLVQET